MGLFDDLKEIVTLRPVWMLTYIRFTFSFTMAIIATIYSVHAVNALHIDPSFLVLLFAFRGVANTLVRIPAGRLSDVMGRKIPLITAFAFLAGVFILLSGAGTPLMIGVAMIIYGAAHGTRAVNEWTFLSDVVPGRKRTLANTYFASVFDLGTAVGATFAGGAAMFLPPPTILRIAAALIGTSVLVITASKVD